MIAPLRSISRGRSLRVTVTIAVTLVSIIVCQLVEVGILRVRQALREAGIVHQQVDLAKALGQRGHRGVERLAVAHVEHARVDFVRAQLGHQRIEPLGPPPGGDAAPAAGDQRADGSRADARRWLR